MKKENRVFDFRTVDTEVKAVQTYSIFTGAPSALSKESPFLFIRDPEGVMRHHVNGSFVNPARRTSFRLETETGVKELDLSSLDSRFEKLIRFLGENGMRVRLSGVPGPEGFGVYRIREIVSGSEAVVSAPRNGLLQMMLERLAAQSPEREKTDEDEPRPEAFFISDLQGAEEYLECAGQTLPEEIRSWAERNIQLLKTGTVSQEERLHAVRSLSMMLNVNWHRRDFEPVDPVRARKILDEELYGLESVKQRIIETIIQINRTHTLPSYGILLAGPAGTGKSQLAYAVARILRLPWTSLDMSAIRDPEALTGSPRLYANAKPGKIMEAFSQAGSSNIVFIINELDKADSDNGSGSPADALLTLLDNLGYTDNYVECRIPTGGVYPIATANDKERISEPLMTRFALIDIPDYTPEEKAVIFSRFSLPRVLRRLKMTPDECIVPDDAVVEIIDRYRSAPGCRDLEQAAEHLAANALYQIETGSGSSVRFTAAEVRKLLD